MSPDRSLARQQRVYRSLLLVYPRAFRQVYGKDMVQVFGDKLRDERAKSGRRAGLVIWYRTLLDLFKSAPLQRMEKSMSREAAFSIMCALLVAFAAVAFVMGTAGPGLIIGVVALAVAAILLGFSGAFKKDRARGAVPAGKFSIREWWVVLAGLMGVVEIYMGLGQLLNDPKIENVLALVAVGGAGVLALVGGWFRTRSRSSGDWMIVFGVLPFALFFWAIWPPVTAAVVVIMALIDSAKARHSEPASA